MFGKNNPLSSMIDNAGKVADGGIIRMPLTVVVFCRTAVVTPD
jgi:hypothetical protein